MDDVESEEMIKKENPQAAACMSNLASFYYVQGDGQQADKLYRQSIALKSKLSGESHVDIAADLIGLGKVCVANDKYSAAGPLYERAIAILKKAQRPGSAETERQYADIQAKLSKY